MLLYQHDKDRYYENHFPRDRAGVTHMRVTNEALELITALFATLTKLSLAGSILPNHRYQDNKI